MSVRVRLEGFRELEAELGKLSRAAGKGALRRAGVIALQPMAAIASAAAPEDTGALKRDIGVSAKAQGGKVGDAEFSAVMRAGGSRSDAVAALRTARRSAGGGAPSVELFMGPVKGSRRNAIKAIVQEFGSSKQSPRPYMRPAWDADKQPMLERLKALLWLEVQRSVARAERRAARLATAG